MYLQPSRPMACLAVPQYIFPESHRNILPPIFKIAGLESKFAPILHRLPPRTFCPSNRACTRDPREVCFCFQLLDNPDCNNNYSPAPCLQAYLLQTTDTWPLKAAVAQIQRKADEIEQIRNSRMHKKTYVDFVMSHCKELDLAWIIEKLQPILSVEGQAGIVGAEMAPTVIPRLFVYEKCRQTTDLGPFVKTFGAENLFAVDSPDPSFVARGDECLAYLNHIVHNWEGLGDYT